MPFGLMRSSKCQGRSPWVKVKRVALTYHMEETIGLPKPKLRLVALVPHHGAEFEEVLIFTDEDTAMRYWRAIPKRDCVSYVPMFEDLYSDGWVFSLTPGE